MLNATADHGTYEKNGAHNAISGHIRHFIIQNFLFGEEAALPGDEVSLLQRGLIDSLGVLDLVSFVEQQFGIKVGEEDMIPENFDSVTSLTSYVCARAASVNREAAASVAE